MKDVLLSLLAQLFPLIAGVVASITFQFVKQASDAIEALPALAKQLAVLVIAAILAFAGNWLGIAVPPDLGAIDGTAWSAIITAAFGLAYHAIQKGVGGGAKG